MIILEGPDGSGKTRLAQWLQNQLGIQIRHSIGPVPELVTWLLQQVILQQKQSPVIYDRFFFSELVYGPIFHRRSVYPPTFFDFFFDFLPTAHPLVIICLPPFDQVWANVERDSHMDGVRENIASIWDEYASQSKLWEILLIMRNVHLLHYDWTNREEITDAVLKHLKGKLSGI